ncbi:hypothetical protein [Paracoccus sp. KR1-242]|uniref:hypothetical protein n=1 Tax=Paracoccus sp. KR1-242 TaxID=3410028 RepID=UPI003C0858DA
MKRRGFLKLAPAAFAAGTVPVAALDRAVEAEAQTQENPELLVLGEKLPEIEQAYQEARAAWFEAWEFWSPQWPLAPEQCCNKWGGLGYGRELERDLVGCGLIRDGEAAPWSIKTAAEMEEDIDRARALLAKDDKRKRSLGKGFRRYRYQEIATAELGLALLPGYLAERARIVRESGFAEIHKKRNTTSSDLFALVRRIVTEPSRTMEGVKIKAAACAALSRMHRTDCYLGHMDDSLTHKTSLAGMLGAALLEVI